MRILVATPQTDAGGLERIVITLTRDLCRRGHRVAAFGPSGRFEQELHGIGAERATVPERGRSPLGALAATFELARVARRWRPDVVHAHNPKLTGIAVLAVRLGRGPRRPPVLATFHGGSREDGPVAARLLRLADLVTAVSGKLAERLHADGVPLNRLRVVPNAVAVEPVDPAAPPPLALGGERLVLAIGRLVPLKNHQRLLEAAALVAGERPDVRFAIVGAGPLHDRLAARAAELGLDGRAALTGFRSDVPALLAQADLLVVSSDSEGQPLAVLEAMAVGTPVVSTPADGMRELLAGAGRVVEDFESTTLARGIAVLLDDDDLRAELGEQGRAVAAARTPEAMVDRYEVLYRELARSAYPR